MGFVRFLDAVFSGSPICKALLETTYKFFDLMSLYFPPPPPTKIFGDKKKKKKKGPNGTSLPKINYVKYKIEIAIVLTNMLTLLLSLF